MKYQDINAQTITSWVEDGWEWGKPITHEQFLAAKAGKLELVLTPTKPVPREWLGDVAGKKVLGLASGGAQQMPILAARGAICTVLDYTPRQLESERAVAEREGYAIEIIRADMTEPLPFPDGTFDLIVHPVSNCYAREVLPIFRECFRVLKKGGVLVSGLDNGINFMVAEEDERTIVNALPFDPLRDPQLLQEQIAGGSGVQFSHTAQEQIGGQLEAGFILTALYEDTNGSGFLHEMNIPTFWATRAVKP